MLWLGFRVVDVGGWDDEGSGSRVDGVVPVVVVVRKRVGRMNDEEEKTTKRFPSSPSYSSPVHHASKEPQ